MFSKINEAMTSQRKVMVDTHIAGRGVENERVLKAMKSVPREAFMPEDVDAHAYEDSPMPIGQGQTISQPFIVAMMADLADAGKEDKVLEIGTGSGYGAAVLADMAGQVYTLERHQSLADKAGEVLQNLGYDNVKTLVADGSAGLPAHAPYDAIVVTAGAPEVPQALKDQLAVGGRLVIPVGRAERTQRMLLLVKQDDGTFAEEDYGMCAFVPLKGKQGWKTLEDEKTENISAQEPLSDDEIADLLARDAELLPEVDSPHFGEFFDRLGEYDVVCLGESSHGTGDFYRARAAITQRLIRNHGFTIVALESDYPDTAVLDGFVRERDVPDIGQLPFSRFPEWMWRNVEFRQLVDWMKKHNEGLESKQKAGIYGLDLYSLNASINAIIDFLEKKDPELAEIARERYGCLEPWLGEPINYGRTMLTERIEGCEGAAVRMLMDLMEERESYKDGFADNFLDVTRNAETIVDAEKYYRSVFLGSHESWNLRDRHMFNTLRAIIKARHESPSNAKPKAVVWAHNSHLGDARATEMGQRRGELNLGQLCRENFGDKAALVGFGTGQGEVAAANDWGGTMHIKSIRQPLEGSFEKLWQKSGTDRALLDIRYGLDQSLRQTLEKDYLQRAIGVIYRPETERMSHYFDAAPADQFDYYVWLNETRAVTPLEHISESGPADTYPFGL